MVPEKRPPSECSPLSCFRLRVEIWINGELLTRQKNQLKQKLSVVTQEYSMRQDMTMNEIMEYQGRLYYMPIKRFGSGQRNCWNSAG